ncbi:high-affinity choline transporter 1 [Aplysia californica]|uniref:High-affinity choline transporter 1 n=1 Tax=Aplysia californica TaxID=6500 RepID=A0ABM0ZUX1_APLCA|nr:high-affinity choline transporter 1 [Aplysia californica]
MLADRSIGIFVGCFTMTATWVGGGYINGTAEFVAWDGFVWCQAPIGYALSLVFGGLFFAEKMRSSGFTTMLDPFHWKYGDIMNCLLYLPALMGDVFWSGAILAALGATLKVIMELDLEIAIIVSAAIALLYTLLGGLYSVAYTDVIQLICMFIGLWLTIPFAMTHEAVDSITTNSSDKWLGSLEGSYAANYIDYYLLLICGGIPWQVYWQRALSAKSVQGAQMLSFLGAIGCLVMAVPAVLVGAVSASTNWNATSYGHPALLEEDRTLTLALVIRHLCPPAVTFIGLGAVSAAVMSSTDSSVLSSSSMFARNVFGVIYARIYGTKPSDSVQVWVMRGAQVVITILACLMAISVKSVYGLWLLCSDLVFVTIFPQLICVMYLKDSNAYGSLASFVLGLVFRLLGGEKSLDLPAAIEYPWFTDGTQLFPFRTLSMIVSLVTLILVSYLAKFLFEGEVLPLSLDVYGCFQHLDKKASYVDQSSEVTEKPATLRESVRHRDVTEGGEKKPVIITQL